MACCCVGTLGERRGSVAVLGVALPCFSGAFLLLREGEGRRGGEGGGWKAGVTGSRYVLSARAVWRLLTDTVYLASVLWSATAGGLALGLSVWLTSVLCSTWAEGLALGLSDWLLVVCFCLGVLSDCSCFLVSVWKFCWLSLSDCSLLVCSCSLVCCFCWLCCSSCNSCVNS